MIHFPKDRNIATNITGGAVWLGIYLEKYDGVFHAMSMRMAWI
ncbi:hypothetical protein RLEG12_30970 [Rhizobium leguminosarum bv. trifolii CB782]|nr:hypothetical protein RLEG12_30970 [Rhizobium leguminosarum bv. trifolii CB782]